MSRSNPQKHWENTQKFGSCPVRRTALLSAFNALLSDGPLVSRPVSRQSCLYTLVFPAETGGFAAGVVGFVLVLVLEPTAAITSTSTISLSTSTTEPAHRRVGCGPILRRGDHKLALVADDLKRVVEDRSQRVHLHYSQWDRKNSAISLFPT